MATTAILLLTLFSFFFSDGAGEGGEMDGRGGKYRRDASRRILPIFSLFLSDGTREEEEGGEERDLPRGPH